MTDRVQLICPNCGRPLTLDAEKKPHVLRCERGHAFDVAKQGYVNLLLPQKRGATPPGDSADMVRARTAFLDGGYYEAFSDGVNALLQKALSDTPGQNTAPMIADAGCGEGYYTQRLCAHLCDSGFDAMCVGFDLSRDAVSHASRRANAAGYGDRLTYAVASLFEMPLGDASVDGIVNLFAPTAEEEFARVIKQGGYLLLAVPGEHHLWGLKEALYETPYENEVRRDSFSLFTLCDICKIRKTVTVKTREHIHALFMMTPYYWKTSPKDAQKLASLETLATEISFDLLLYRKG